MKRTREIGDEPWNNGYVLAAEVERLLERLKAGPMTGDQIERHFLYASDLHDPLGGSPEPETVRIITTGLRDFIKSLGRSHSFGNALTMLRNKEEHWRQSVDWELIPPNVRKLARRRADCVVSHACRKGLIERDRGGGGGRITESGLAALRSGEFAIR